MRRPERSDAYTHPKMNTAPSRSSSSSVSTDGAPSKETELSRLRSEVGQHSETLSELCGADEKLARAETSSRELGQALRRARVDAARATAAHVDARDALYRAHRDALSGLVPGRHARRSAALRVAEMRMKDAEATLMRATRSYNDATSVTTCARGDAAAFADTRTRMHKALDTAFAGYLKENQVLPARVVRLRAYADMLRDNAEGARHILRELVSARRALHRALVLLVDYRARTTVQIDMESDDQIAGIERLSTIDERSVRDMMPSTRLRSAEAAVATARRHMHAASALAPHLPLQNEQYARAALLNAFVEVSGDRQRHGRVGVLVPKGFFEFAARRVSDALGAIAPSLKLQRGFVVEADFQFQVAHKEASEAEDQLYSRRKDTLYASN